MDEITPKYTPTKEVVQQSNVYEMMNNLGLSKYKDFYDWSQQNREMFWKTTSERLGIKFHKKPTNILNLKDGIEQAHWFYGSKLNIAKSCFNADPEQDAISFQKCPNSPISSITYKELLKLCSQVANGLYSLNVQSGDTVAIDMPMTVEAIAIYLGSIMAGIKVVTIADSFTSEEIKVRLDITKPKWIFTVDSYARSDKEIQLYKKVKNAGNYPCIVLQNSRSELSSNDLSWLNFLSDKETFKAKPCSPEDTMTILFSSGTTGNPKAIPWNHTTPIKSASDGFYHHDIHEKDVVCWPTNLGWMMGPWLVFATFINKGTIALYYDSPLGEGFGEFVQNAKVNMLGVVPSLVRVWRASEYMETLDWSNIKCFSSTGECSNPSDMEYLMDLADNKPVIEYCGGTETGGGYLTGTIIQDCIPGTFSTPALGGGFIILGEEGNETTQGEVFLTAPTPGLSIKLLNRDHHAVYYKDCPKHNELTLRRHSDQIEQLPNGYFKAHGRMDDSMNLGGIKVSSTQIEETVNQLSFIKESAAIGVPPAEGGPDQLVLCIVLQKDILIEKALAQTRKEVKNKINPLFKVAECHFYKSLPRTASNKVMRRKLRKELS